MTEQVSLNGISRSDRHGVISAIAEAVSTSGGWVDDVNFFSNVAVSLRCIVRRQAVPFVVEELGKLKIGLAPDELAALGRAASTAEADVTISLHITFVHDKPDLRRHVPSVPG